MAFCANCGHEMSDLAPHCPNCGHPNEGLAPATPSSGVGSLAGFWRRFLAILIDAIIIGLVTSPLGGTEIDRSAFDNGDGVSVSIRPVGNVVFFLYQWLMLALNDGKTLGAMALGLRVAKPDGTKIGLGTAAARQAMAIVSGLALLIGYLWAAWDGEKRTWHDMVAQTRVFRTR